MSVPAKRLYALCGSLRARSTNRALLEAIRRLVPHGVEVEISGLIDRLPIFNPDLEGDLTPEPVLAFAREIATADGLIVSAPEYAHGIPGGLKNALDWLVSRFEIPGKPVMLVHASHRGDFALEALTEVLKTIGTDLRPEAFLRVPLLGKSEDEIAAILGAPETEHVIRSALVRFVGGVAGKHPASR
ncbi:NADPH-dependent FMN reductase [Ciceribacter azotifigens]|uniref:NADPH-dependent FMN reductase n=1 Tax=Ciceribacter azotifigens TaxID=2069303 RepID=UPI003A85C95C